jgi:uncharacterized protein with HEPN domain
MRDRISDKERLLHILDAIYNIQDFTRDLSYDQYLDDLKLKLAVVKLFEIIGEAVSSLSPEIQKEYPDIEWNVIRSARNVLIHEYFGIDYKIVWNSIHENIPKLKEQINHIMTELY